MTLLWHIAKKDLRHLRWPTAAWVILTAFEAVIRAVGPLFVDVNRRDAWYTFETLVGFVPLTRGLLYVLIAALLVFTDPLVGTEAFWLTRPIPRRTLFAGKLLAGTLILIVPSLVAQIVLMVSFGVPRSDIAEVAPDLVLGSILMLVLALFAAGLASGLTQFTLALVGIAIVGWTGLAVAAAIAFRSMEDFELPIPRYQDPTPQLVMLVLALIGLVAVTWYHYRTRRRWRSLLLAAASLTIACLGASYWPDVSFYGGEPQLPAAMRDPQVTRLRLARPVRHVKDESPFSPMDRRSYRNIAAPLVLDGVPEGFWTEAFTVRTTVRPATGVVIEGKRASAVLVDVETGKEHPRAMLSVYGQGFPRSRRAGTVLESWPTLFRIPVDTLRRTPQEAHVGTYAGTFLYRFGRRETLTTLPLQPRVDYRDGPRSVTVWLLGEHGDACAVLIRRTILTTRRWIAARPTLFEWARDRVANQPLVMQQRHGTYHMSVVGTSLDFLANQSFDEWFDVSYAVFDVRPREAEDAPDLQTTGQVSCAALDLVFERHSYAGRLERTFAIPDFHLDPQPGDLTEDPSETRY